ncbi:acid-sensing ion channel 5-like [Amphiura filiformis]|uniref:acid-sensing ion channel 5-like n=1 Tax=Amphiura filiformis TaxID=82378 RepID=UPI003B21DD5E
MLIRMSNTDESEEKSLERHFIESTTLHGIPQQWDNARPSWLRGFWFLAFFACLGTGLWQISLRIAEYRAYLANTKITLEYNNELQFPAITICNFNRYRGSEVSDEDWPYLEYALFAEEYDYDSYEDDGKFEQSSFSYYALFENSTFNFTEFTRRAGFVLDNETLLDCKWRGRPCYAENFTHVFTSYGNCWTFNNGVDEDGNYIEILSEDQPGAGNGLYLVVDIQQAEYTESLQGNPQAGLKILAHDQEAPPLMDALGSAIPPGFYSYISLRRNKYKNLQEPWGKCDKNRHLEHYWEYTLSGCFIECKLQHIVSECGCRPVRYPGEATECSPRQSATCVKDVIARLNDGILEPCYCPVPCQYIEYSTTVSYGAFPSQSVAEEAEAHFNVSVDYQRNNFVVLDVFYEELNYQRFEQQKAISVSSLISDIGGNLGLFIGASILTFAEFIDYFVKKSLKVCTSRKNQAKEKGHPLGNKVKDVWSVSKSS